MPAVRERPITQLNQEVLVAGLLPTIWMIAIGAIFGIAFVVMQPKGLGILKPVAVAAVALAVAVPVHRTSRTKIIKHYIAWNDSGIGGLQGRDLNPVPHMYVEMDEQTAAWTAEMRRQDLARGAAFRREVTAARREENRYRNVKPKERRGSRDQPES
ncbi:hypothetical protein IHN32_12430 [Deinococcus sp. 14RED07]|uniref:RnfABCDGE type electron transport complex subunit D n=1 Tax=Deinococcus sp. 14RED07 TaxID=2745874 RepID=UPI001E35E201|nr:RnfABCDGE type electron transport complex subunit D [Deinococcus sp. 14RED07]MCD0176749.1 hypothetical protein [Deinococcus sp. 14RED07]